jgi:quercetin dioxygenase-like cupin family protein
MSAFAELASIGPHRIWPGVVGRLVAEGGRLTVAIVELDPGALVPPHEHQTEQIGLVIEGSATVTVGSETAELGPGGCYCIPPGRRHQVRAGAAGAVLADVFAPAREDWAALERLTPTAPRWPRP